MASPLSGPLDEEILRRIQVQLEALDHYERVEFDPSPTNFRNVAAHYDAALYSERITGARLDIRWYVGGDYSVHYVEEWADGERWECRWDRHPEDVGRMHFHPPPDADTPESTDLPTDYRDVLSLVRTFIAERIEATWTDVEP